MKKPLWLALILFMLNFNSVVAWAQGTARVVQTCGTLPQAYTPGSTRDSVQDVNGNFCIFGAGSTTANQGTPNTAGNAWPVYGTVGGAALSATNGWWTNILQGNAVLSNTNPLFSEITDGTNGPVAVKPASTAAGAADKSFVTQLNPLSPGIIALGQATKANSVPSVTASDQLGPQADTGAQAVLATPTSSATSGITPVVGGSAVSSLVLKNAAGNLYSVYANCTAACWLMVFNATSAPSNGATTAGNAASNMVECVPIGAGSIGGINYGVGPPAVYSTGITATISSTACATLTLSTVGFIHGMVK